MESKICSKCKVEKPVGDFYTRTDQWGTRPKSQCKECESKSKARPLDVIPDLEDEIWLPINGTDGAYLRSNMGRVRRVMHRKNPTNRLMTLSTDGNGYKYVVISVLGKRQELKIHRLVAEAFIPNPENLPLVLHVGLYPDGREGNKEDNRAISLKWGTQSENIQHAYDFGLKEASKGSSHGSSKLTEKDVLEIRAIGRTMSAVQLGALYGVNDQAIYKILSRQRWKHI